MGCSPYPSPVWAPDAGGKGVAATCELPSSNCARNKKPYNDGWVWADSSPVDFTLWTAGHPTAWGNGGADCASESSTEDCVEAWRGGADWNDAGCDGYKPYICGLPCDVDVEARLGDVPLQVQAQHSTLRHVEVSGHSAYGGGGADLGAGISCVNSTCNAAYTTFRDNVQKGFGAAALFASASVVNISYCKVKNNRNLGVGSAAVYVTEGSTLTVSHSVFRGNQNGNELGIPDRLPSIDWTGSPVQADPDALARGVRASAILADSSDVSVGHTRFLYNAGSSVLSAVSSRVDVTNVFFGHNKATSSTDHSTTMTLSESSSVLSLSDGSVAYVEASTFTRNEAQSAAILVTGLGTILTVSSSSFINNVAVSTSFPSSGAVVVSGGAGVAIERSTFVENEGSSPWSAGAIFATDSTLIVVDTEFTSNVASGILDTASNLGAGGVYTGRSHVDIDETVFKTNLATGAITPVHVNTMLIQSPPLVKVLHTSFSPFVDNGRHVAVSGKLGGCNEHPCDPGYGCTYANYSLACTQCSRVLHSANGRVCTSCPMGKGPVDEMTRCEMCGGNNHSSFGVCLPCPPEKVPSEDRSRCEDCIPRQIAVAGAEHDARTCGCDEGFYNASAGLSVCFDDHYSASQLQSTQELYSSTITRGQTCLECVNDLLGNPCLECKRGSPPTLRDGYTAPQVSSPLRRRLQADIGAQLVFRCHDEMEIGAIRCPAKPSAPGECSPGYVGLFCQSCDQDLNGTRYGYDTSSRTCDACETTGVTGKAIGLVLAIFAGAVVIGVFGLKRWKK
jgi:hypothetical protein